MEFISKKKFLVKSRNYAWPSILVLANLRVGIWNAPRKPNQAWDLGHVFHLIGFGLLEKLNRTFLFQNYSVGWEAIL